MHYVSSLKGLSGADVSIPPNPAPTAAFVQQLVNIALLTPASMCSQGWSLAPSAWAENAQIVDRGVLNRLTVFIYKFQYLAHLTRSGEPDRATLNLLNALRHLNASGLSKRIYDMFNWHVEGSGTVARFPPPGNPFCPNYRSYVGSPSAGERDRAITLQNSVGPAALNWLFNTQDYSNLVVATTRKGVALTVYDIFDACLTNNNSVISNIWYTPGGKNPADANLALQAALKQGDYLQRPPVGVGFGALDATALKWFYAHSAINSSPGQWAKNNLRFFNELTPELRARDARFNVAYPGTVQRWSSPLNMSTAQLRSAISAATQDVTIRNRQVAQAQAAAAALAAQVQALAAQEAQAQAQHKAAEAARLAAARQEKMAQYVAQLRASNQEQAIEALAARISLGGQFTGGSSAPAGTSTGGGILASGGGHRCPEGQAWNVVLGKCLPVQGKTPASTGGSTSTGGGTFGLSAGSCPEGQTWSVLRGGCIPVSTQGGGGSSGGGSSGGGSSGGGSSGGGSGGGSSGGGGGTGGGDRDAGQGSVIDTSCPGGYAWDPARGACINQMPNQTPPDDSVPPPPPPGGGVPPGADGSCGPNMVFAADGTCIPGSVVDMPPLPPEAPKKSKAGLVVGAAVAAGLLWSVLKG